MKSKSNHYSLSDSEFIKQFEDCTLDPALFDHEAHLRLAWLLVNQLGQEKAVERIQAMLLNFVECQGATDKYHVTVTVAATKAIYSFMRNSNTERFRDFISENPELKTNFKGLIRSHYSTDIFSSEKARLHFQKPDLLPFS